MMDGQWNDKNNKDNKTNNDTQNTTQKTKDWTTRPTSKYVLNRKILYEMYSDCLYKRLTC